MSDIRDLLLYVGSQQHYKAKEEREGWKMGGPSAQGKLLNLFLSICIVSFLDYRPVELWLDILLFLFLLL